MEDRNFEGEYYETYNKEKIIYYVFLFLFFILMLTAISNCLK